MATTPQKPCLECRRTLTTETYCDQCRPKVKDRKASARQKYDTNRGTTTQRGYGTDWQKVRRIKLDRDPVCQCSRCQEMGRARVANVVHHINPVETHPELRLVMSNLMSMHPDCHEVEEGRARDREYEDWKQWEQF